MAKGTILVVDDDPTIQGFVGQALDEEGYRVLPATAEQAAGLAAALQPDLILLDVMMPRVDGVAVSQAVRAAPATAHIPIVAMTSHRPQTAPAMRADAWLCKPFELEELCRTVETWVTHGPQWLT